MIEVWKLIKSLRCRMPAKAPARSHPDGYSTADHGWLHRHAHNQGRSCVAIHPDYRGQRLRECRVGSSRRGAWTPRHGSVPAGQMGKLWSNLYLCQTAANIDCDQRSDVDDGEAVAGNESMPL